MRTLVISDVHANLNAFQAVLASAGTVDRVWFLGDILGYGPDPNECVAFLQTLPNLTALMGNHDAALMDYISVERFNQEAADAVLIQRDLVSFETRDYLETLHFKIELDQVTLAHGSPRNPIWEYILTPFSAAANFAEFDTPACLVGHSHIPLIFPPATWNWGKPACAWSRWRYPGVICRCAASLWGTSSFYRLSTSAQARTVWIWMIFYCCLSKPSGLTTPSAL